MTQSRDSATTAVGTTAAWTIVALVTQIALTTFVNFVVFPQHWLDPIERFSCGLINTTLLANLVMLTVLGVLLLGIAKLKPESWGWRNESIRGAIFWGLVALIVTNALEGWATWSAGDRVTIAHVWSSAPGYAIGDFCGQIFGNALLEELLYRGLLVTQLAMVLAGSGRPARRVHWLGALLFGQVVFALIHVPNRVAAGLYDTPTDFVLDMVVTWLLGVLLGLCWWASGSLLVAVAIHSVMNDPLYLLEPGNGPGGQVVILLVIPMALSRLIARRTQRVAVPTEEPMQ